MTLETNPIVVKVSGTLLDDDAAMDAFWQAVSTLQAAAPVVVVHGGGKQATAMAQRLNHEPRVVNGRRVTSDLDLDIMQWALRGKLNTQLVAEATQHGLTAVGLSGVDGGTVQVTKRPPWSIEGESVDFGWVGDVQAADPHLLLTLLAQGLVPVVAPLGIDAEGQVYNVNADTIARTLADALGAAELLLVTATGGVRRHPGEAASNIAVCDEDLFEDGQQAGWIRNGMQVKLDVAFEALHAGVGEVVICAPDDLIARTHATRVVV